MAKIKLLTCLSGETITHKPGTIYECGDAEAARHVANGNGVLVTDEPETAAADGAAETADAPPARKGRK